VNQYGTMGGIRRKGNGGMGNGGKSRKEGQSAWDGRNAPNLVVGRVQSAKRGRHHPSKKEVRLVCERVSKRKTSKTKVKVKQGSLEKTKREGSGGLDDLDYINRKKRRRKQPRADREKWGGWGLSF